jgi:hypothetical protein
MSSGTANLIFFRACRRRVASANQRDALGRTPHPHPNEAPTARHKADNNAITITGNRTIIAVATV